MAAAAAVGTVAPGAVAPAAAAAPPAAWTCGPDDWLDGVTVPGDVVVEGDGCWLLEAHVLGDVRVADGAVARVTATRVDGDVVVGAGAEADLDDVVVAGGVQLDRAADVRIVGEVGRSVRGKTDRALLSGTVRGAINIAVPQAVRTRGLTLWRADVGGWVNVHGGATHVADVTLRRGLTLSWVWSSVVSEADVAADLTVRRAHQRVDVGHLRWTGGGWVDGPPARRTTVGGDLLVQDNASRVVVGATDVAGDVDCTGGAVTPRLTDVTIGGARTGRCAG
ncbi:hypothetical protein ACFUMH_02580 [Cellulomonas sp. NPDC057328]|uniref:hypothetical protein n=1 Tax=Cellulomonas sp. NPDC057328 TaxID=3346101 RepID=UPI00363FA8BC